MHEPKEVKMMLTVKGLILREKKIGEISKSVSVLTADKGVIDVFIRGGQKSVKNGASTQLFAYSALCLDEKKKASGQTEYFLNSSELINAFPNIRLDLKKTALAAYFSELILYSRTEQSGYHDVMRLVLNSLYFLENDKMDMDLLKCVFEFRLPCEIGLRPDLVGCAQCFKYEDEKMHFDFRENKLFCDECYITDEDSVQTVLDKTLLYIVRYIALTEFEKLFYFRISSRCQSKLTEFTESFIAYNFKSRFRTLEYYKSI